MNNILKIYKPQIEDIVLFEKLNESKLKTLLFYSENSLKIIGDGISKCDNKAISQIPFLLTLYGVYVMWIKNYLITKIILKCVFYINTLLVLLILILSLSCILVRVHTTLPPIANILEWLKNESDVTRDKRLLPTILFKIAEAEYDSYNLLRTKVRLLRISQICIFIVVTLILGSLLISIF